MPLIPEIFNVGGETEKGDLWDGYAPPTDNFNPNHDDKGKFVGEKVGKAEHVRSAEIEQEVADAIGGKVVLREKGKQVYKDVEVKGGHAVEVKSMLKGSKRNISVHDDALLRKVEGAEKNKETFHTIAVDDRKTYQGGVHADKYSGQRIYYKRGSGRYSLSQMHPVNNPKELRKLIKASDVELPELAKGSLPTGDREKLRAAAAKAHEARLAKDRARKQRLRADNMLMPFPIAPLPCNHSEKSFMEAGPLLRDVTLSSLFASQGYLDAENLDRVDVSKPLLIARDAQGRNVIFDGHHRAVKLKNDGKEMVRAYVLEYNA